MSWAMRLPQGLYKTPKSGNFIYPHFTGKTKRLGHSINNLTKFTR